MNELPRSWTDWIARAEAVDIGEVAMRLGAKLRRAGTELVGPCPCGAATSDGFCINGRKGIFLCRPSGASGNVIDMARHILGCGFAEALEAVTGEPRPDRSHDETPEERDRRASMRAEREAKIAEQRRRDEIDELSRRRRDEEAVAEIIARAVPIAGTHAEAYLRARGLTPARRLTGDLRFVGDLNYWGWAGDATRADNRKAILATLPAMVAIIRNVAGDVIGVHQTFLDPVEPRKWAPIGSRENASKKVRGEARGGLIRLGMLGDKLALGEGICTTFAWHALGHGPEDISLAAAISLGNMAGGCTGSIAHRTAVGTNGKPVMVRNGVPDMDKPGVILPDDVREVILLGDGDSDPMATHAAVATAGRRFRAQGRTVAVHWAGAGLDWNDVLMRQRADVERAA